MKVNMHSFFKVLPVSYTLRTCLCALLWVLGTSTTVQAESLRCGYSLQPPLLVRDTTTGTLSGPAVAIMDELADRLALQLEWTEETTPEHAAEGLNAKRFDAFCTPTPRWAPLQKDLAYTQTLFFSPTYIYARTDDRRFGNNDTRINQPDVTLAVIDGTPYPLIQKEEFAKTRELLLPPASPPEAALQAVVEGRADIAFASPLTAGPYLEGHKDKIRPIPGLPPFRIHAHALAVSKERREILPKLDTVLADREFQKRLRTFLSTLPITYK